MNFKVKGVIKRISKVSNGETKDGKKWSNLTYLVETNEEYNNLYNFSIFQFDDSDYKSVDNFLKYNKVNDFVEVEFTVRTQEYKDKFYTTLNNYKCVKLNDNYANLPEIKLNESKEDFDDLPF